MSAVRFAGFDDRRHFKGPAAPRRASAPDPNTALWYDRGLPPSRFLLNRDLVAAECVAAAALDWDKAANVATARVRHAYQRRAMRFDAMARRLSWARKYPQLED